MTTGTDTGTMDTFKRAGKPAGRLPMTPARRLTLAIGLPVLAALIGWTGLSVVANVGTDTYQFSRTPPVAGGTLSAHFGDASVTLVPGSPGSPAQLTGTITYSLVRPNVTFTGSTVSYHCPVPAGQCSLDSTLTVPPATNVNLSSGTGDLTVNGTLNANLSLSTSSGDLTANGLAGKRASLTTSVGNITASGITADDVTVSSDTGDVTLTFTRVPDSVTVNSGVGDVSIVLPRGTTQYDVQMSTNVGNTSSTVPQDTSSPHTINVTSSTGDISITTG